MFGRAALKLSAIVFLGLAILAGPAHAVTILPGSNTVLTPGETYNAQEEVFGPGTHIYQFAVPSGSIWTISNAHNGIDPIGNLAVTWWQDAVGVGGTFLGLINLSGGENGSLALSLVSGVSYFVEVVFNTAGQYTLSVTATPLPPALILFLTALGGLTWLGRRRHA